VITMTDSAVRPFEVHCQMMTWPIRGSGGRACSPQSFAAHVHVSALTYCTTMMTRPSGLSVTVYQMVKPSDGR
jgi:hypothetical protein